MVADIKTFQNMISVTHIFSFSIDKKKTKSKRKIEINYNSFL